MTISTLTLLISEIVALISVCVPLVIWLVRVIEGIRCQLRSDMLSIYYECKDDKKIRQYKAEHFDKCYHAYKALKGNSFIDDIYKAKRTWEIIT